MNPEKVETVMKFKPPRNKRDIHSYMGFLNFYRKYIKKTSRDHSTDLLNKDRN